MSMTTRVIGFRPPDDTWSKYKKVYDTCIEADINPPEEVMKFFNLDSCDEGPDESGVEVDINDAIVDDWGIGGYQIDITKLPRDVKIIRFTNSW